MKTFQPKNHEELRLFLDVGDFARAIQKIEHRRKRLEAKKRDQRRGQS